MSFWDRALDALGIRKTTGEVVLEGGDRIVLRDLARAKAFPQEPAQPGHKDLAACEKCGGRLRRVVFTTAGSGDQIEIWRQHPFAMDGWVCVACGWAAMPRFISSEESVEFTQTGAEHVQLGQFDDAEFWFRRILGSWPGYPAAYANLGQLSFARADAAPGLADKHRYREEAETWLRRAVAADPERRIPAIRVTLARVLALRGEEDEALGTLDSLSGDSRLPAEVREAAAASATDIRCGKALFSRATELTEETILEPISKPLSPEAKGALETARTLLKQASERERSFPTSWFLGKVEARLGHLEAAIQALRHACSLDPDQPDGCRELCLVYLEAGRAEDAVPIARHAVELRPKDAGLSCNLAIALLLHGDVEGASAQCKAALELDPQDEITRGVQRLIEDVAAGRRPRPKSLPEAEGRKR